MRLQTEDKDKIMNEMKSTITEMTMSHYALKKEINEMSNQLEIIKKYKTIRRQQNMAEFNSDLTIFSKEFND